MNHKIDTTKLRESANLVRQSVIELGCAMKPAAEAVIRACKDFERLSDKLKKENK